MSGKSVLFRTVKRHVKAINYTPIALSCGHYQRFHQQNGNKHKTLGKFSAVSLLGFTLFKGKDKCDDEDTKKKPCADKSGDDKCRVGGNPDKPGEKVPNLPTYRASEVMRHNTCESLWVTYKHGVYDITKFLPSHPGGDQILEAAGLSIEGFWNIYGQHHTPAVYKILESYRIGNLHDDDVCDMVDDGLWEHEPARDSRLVVKTKKPFNAETPPHLLIDTFYTPNEVFYVRQHMPVPQLERCSHTIEVTVRLPGHCHNKQFTLEDLDRKFDSFTIPVALMCAGNRRTEMNKIKEVKGLSWKMGAIGNAEWTGVMLRDVLLDCGVEDDFDEMQGKHVILRGADIDATGTNFSTSIPLTMAMSSEAQVMLATHMNGRELTPDHGYPVRVIVPGAPAVRSVKWLESITVSEKESPSHWHQKDYRSFNPSVTWETADFSRAPPVYSLPVTSAICEPLDGCSVKVDAGNICIKGYAYSGGGARIVRVDVSLDCGKTWTEATLNEPPDPTGRHSYTWALWAATLPVPDKKEHIQIWARATDSNFNTQPENFYDIWNIRGILGNAYHKIRVRLTR